MDPRIALDHLLRIGIGPFVAASNPTLYVFVPYALAVVVLAELYILARSVRPVLSQFKTIRTAASAIISLLFLLALPLLTFYGIWWSFLPTVITLPFFSQPGPDDRWLLGIPARASYQVLGAWVHGLIFSLCLFYFAIVFVYPLALKIASLARHFGWTADEDTVLMLMFWASVLLSLGIWEVAQWPASLTVLVELFVAYFFPTFVVGFFRRRTNVSRKYQTPWQLRRAQGCEDLADWFLTLALLTLVMITHSIDWYPLAFYGLYLAASCIDDIVKALHRIVVPKDPEAAYYRWYFTLPVILVIAWLGAAGVLHQVVVWLAAVGLSQVGASSVGYPPALWVEVGAAAGAYAIFYPLTNLARDVIRRRAKQHDTGVEGAPTWVPDALRVFDPLIQLAQLRLDDAERRRTAKPDHLLPEIIVETTLVATLPDDDDTADAPPPPRRVPPTRPQASPQRK